MLECIYISPSLHSSHLPSSSVSRGGQSPSALQDTPGLGQRISIQGQISIPSATVNVPKMMPLIVRLVEMIANANEIEKYQT